MPSFSKTFALKRKTFISRKNAFLIENISFILQHKIPSKYKDPSYPIISCNTGNHTFENTLLYLGVNVNILSYLVFVKLGLRILHLTPVVLQLTDRSMKIPFGIVKDVLIRVDKFYFPIDFIVIDTQPMHDLKKYISIILVRLFLATVNAHIQCRIENIQLSFGNMTLELNIFNNAK